ncbi:MAG: hypothetical protein DRI48_07990, partial [Chloroflexi bacterium]
YGITGLLLGWIIYGWKPLRPGEMDRVEAAMRRVWLGWLYRAMANRFYLDRAYRNTLVKGFIALADLFDRLDYGQERGKHGLVDGCVNLVGKIGKALSGAATWCDVNLVDAPDSASPILPTSLTGAAAWLDVNLVDAPVNLAGSAGRLACEGLSCFDLKVVDGVVNSVGKAVQIAGKAVRPIQTGNVQNYLLRAFLMLLALVITFFIILFLHV